MWAWPEAVNHPNASFSLATPQFSQSYPTITFLEKWDECGERSFLWPLSSFSDRRTYSVHSVQYCLSCVEQFCWELIRTCGFATCCLTHGKQPLIKVMAALAPNTLVQFLSLPHHSTSLQNSLSTCLRLVQLQSNFRQLLTGYIADVAETFESLI